MTVYKGYMKLIARNYKICLIYMMVFLGIAFIIMASTKERETNVFETHRFTVAVYDNDKTEYSKAVKKYIDDNHNIVDLDYDVEKLEKMMYGRSLDYVVTIPKGFGQALENSDYEKTKVDLIKAKNVSFDVFFGFGLENYVNTLVKLNDNLDDKSTVIQGATEIFKNKLEVEILKSNEASQTSDLYYFFRFLPMLFISIFGYIVGFIKITFKNQDLQNRCNVSGVSQRRQFLEILLALATFAMIVYAIVLAIGLTVFRSSLDSNIMVLHYIVNSFICLCFSVGIAFLVGSITKSYSGLNAWVNIFSNVLCFLGGVYVPMSMLAPSVRNISRLLPTYWYEINNNMIGTHTSFTASMTDTFIRNIGLQLLIMFVFISFSLIISRKISRYSK